MRVVIVAIIALTAVACQSLEPKPPANAVVVDFRFATTESRPDAIAMSMGKEAYFVDSKPFLDGSAVAQASAIRNEFGMSSVSLEFDEKGAAKMADVTETSKGKLLAITVDGKLVMVATIAGKFGKYGQISGRLTEAEAKRIAAGLNRTP